MPVANSVLMHLERVRAVFKLVRNRNALGRKLLRLSHRNKPAPELISQRGGENKPARLDADNRIDFHTATLLRQGIDRLLKPLRVLEQRRNVVKIDARLRKVRHLSNKFS